VALISLLLGALLVLEAALVGYLLILALLALVPIRRIPASGGARRRFAILVPAHNEEALIGRLLASLNALDYPRDRYTVCVVADNCTDTTAAIAREHGARVYERFDDTQRAKGFALRWLLQQLRSAAEQYDAYIVVDADSVLAANFLRAMDARLEHGAQVVQAYYSVLNPGDSAVAALRYAALAAVHYLRPSGRSALGLSTGLKGNGMCFAAGVLEQFTWNWFTLAEDVEFHLALVEHGIRSEFAPETWVKGDMPTTLSQARTQNARWERGRLQLIRAHVPRLLWQGVRHRRWLQLDAAAEQLIPPLSVPFAVAFSALAASLLIAEPFLAAAAAACLVGYAAYLLIALVLVRAPLRIYLSLGMAPVYIAWKLGLYARAILGERDSGWVRTARTPTGTASS
jgi:cellulose synthase/poly-beta-1,6-N-acetylglucosamine synthase-like glycosyltransferase